MKWFKKNEIVGDENTEPTPVNILALECEEVVSLWDNKEKKFVRENDIIQVTGDADLSVEVEWTRYKKLSEEDKKRYQRKLAFNYEVSVDGEEGKLGLNKTVKEQIEALNDNLKSLGTTILQKPLLITKKGKGLDTKYSVVLQPQEEVQSETQDSP